MNTVTIVLLGLAVLCLSVVCMNLCRKISGIEKAFRSACERLEGLDHG